MSFRVQKDLVEETIAAGNSFWRANFDKTLQDQIYQNCLFQASAPSSLHQPRQIECGASHGHGRSGEAYLKQMANQRQLANQRSEWDLAEKDLEALQQKQIQLLQEVNCQLQEFMKWQLPQRSASKSRNEVETSETFRTSAVPPSPHSSKQVNFNCTKLEQKSEDLNSSQLPVHSASSSTSSLLKARFEPFRVLVVGATGLLGREIFKAIRRAGWKLRGIPSKSSSPMVTSSLERDDLIHCEITFSALQSQIHIFRPHVVLHLTGTELAESQENDGFPRNNFLANTMAVASACDFCGVWLIHFSSDMVFDGLTGPYTVDAEPSPATQLGHLHLDAEQIVLRRPSRAVVIRVSCLYGLVESFTESFVTCCLAFHMQFLTH